MIVFQGGTAVDELGRLVTAGGRVLTVVGMGGTIEEAASRAYSAPVHFEGMQRRSDVGRQVRPTRSPEPRQLRSPLRSERSALDIRFPFHQGHHVAGLPPESGRARIVVLASGEGSNLQALVDACASNVVCATVVGVVSHSPNAGSLTRARRAGVPTFCVPISSRRDRRARRVHEEALLQTVTALEPDLVVLAGWMLILSPELLSGCRFPIVNVHPALLSVKEEPLDIPVLKGAHAVRKALALRLPYTGVSIHVVTDEVDGGPVLKRQRVDILPDDDEGSLHLRLKEVEHRLLIDVVQSITTSSPIPSYPTLKGPLTGGTYDRSARFS